MSKFKNRSRGKSRTNRVLAVTETLKEDQDDFNLGLKLLEQKLMAEKCWEKLGEIPIDEDDDISVEFKFDGEVFPVGTDRFEIWHWIEEKYNYPVHKLMFGDVY